MSAWGADIEMSFIRTLSIRGLVLSGGISNEDRRERIRVAILQQRLAMTKFSDQLTYAQAYQQCYQRPLDLRQSASHHEAAVAG